MNLYPAIDIRGGRAVRLHQGDYEQETVYDDDPARAAARWLEGGAERLHVVDLDGAREGRPVNTDAIRAIAESAGVPVQVGGGLRDDDAVATVLDAGAERAVIGTAAIRDPEFLDRVLAAYGDRVVVSVDARHGKVAVEGWTESTELSAADLVGALAADRGVQTFVFTPVEVDGTLGGPDIAQIKEVASALDGTGSRLICSGGVGELAHLRSLACLAPTLVEGVIVGKALYEGRFTVAQALAVFEGRELV